MDWRALLDERQRRAGNATVTPRNFYTPEKEEDKDDDGGFFGALADTGKVIGDIGEGAAGFFGGLVKSIVDPAVDAAKGASEAIAENLATATGVNDDIKKTQDKGDSETQKAIQQAIQKAKDPNATPEARDRWKKLAMQWSDEQTGDLKKRSKELEKKADELDPVKFAANVGQTGLNFATGGAGAGARQALKQSVKTAAEQGTKQASKAAVKVVGETAGKGAAIGGGFGALEPLRLEGGEANPEDIWTSALMGGAVGAGVGGGVPLLSKNVRSGLKELPGEVRAGAANFKAGFPQGATEAGFIKNPFGPDEVLNNTNARPKAELQKALEDARNAGDEVEAARITKELDEPGLSATPLDPETRSNLLDQVRDGAPISVEDARVPGVEAPDWAPAGSRRELSPADQEAEQIAQRVASQYASPDEYLAERARLLGTSEKQIKGGQMIDTAGPDATYQNPGGVKRISEHAPWYREHFEQKGRAPSQRDVRDITEEALNGARPGVIDPGEVRVFEILKEREAALQAQLADPNAAPPTNQFDQMEASVTGRPVSRTQSPPRIPAGLQKGPGQTAPLEGLAPESAPGRFNTPDELQAALGAKEAQTNPLVDFVDPNATAAPPPRPGAQTALDTSPSDPYADMPQDLSRPALPAGEAPGPMTVAEARAHFKATGETPAFEHKVRDTVNPLEMPATVEEGSNIAVRQTKGGKIVPVATNNAHIMKDEVDAIRAIAADDTSGAFTSTRTPEMNLEEALRKRGGQKSKEFQVLNQRNVDLREHMAEYTKFKDDKRGLLEKIRSEFDLDRGAQSPAMRSYLEAGDEATSKEAMDAFRKEFGDRPAEGLKRLRDFWRADNKVIREETNEVLKRHAGEDRMIGDLGETYLPRVYRNGPKGFKDAVFDVSHGGMDRLKSMMNLENPSGYLSNESEVAGTALRSVNQAPLNSNLAKPNTTFLSAAQERTANAPIKDMEDPLTSMMRWYEAVGKAKYLTPDIARGRTLQKAIEGVNGETGNLRQMYDSINDQLNAVAGKTSSFDTRLVNTETGNKFVNVATKLQSRVARSTILGSAQSAMAQTGQIPLAIAENGPKNWVKGMADMVGHLRSRRDGPIAESSLMRTRYPTYDDLFTTKKTQKAGKTYTNFVAKPFRVIERANAEATWYSSYNRVLGEGLTGKEAAKEADRITAKIIGERSPGARAALYESKALGPVTSYTLEVNQLYQMGKQYFKRDPKKAAMLVGAIWLYNQGYESLTGNKLNADPIDAVSDAAGILGNQELIDENGDPIGTGERIVRAGARLGGEAVDATPLGGQVAGTLYPEKGFRIPFSGGERTMAKADVFGGTNFGRYDSAPPIAAGLSNPLLLLGIPGMNQAQKSVEGLRAYDEGGSFASDGDAKFLIDQNQENYWRSLLWGIYNTPEGKAYLKDQQSRISGSM